jgi:hypothetical protein
MQKKQWQVEISTMRKQEVPEILYGETLALLREQAFTWLKEVRPAFLQSGNFECHRGSGGAWERFQTKDDKQVYQEFCNNWLDISRGPNHEDPGVINGLFQPVCARKMAKQKDLMELNRMLRRGWHILTWEKLTVLHVPGGPLIKEEGVETTYFILGHTEEDAF